MTFAYFVFAFCSLALFCSLMVVISKNPIHSILYLILAFCNISFVLIALGLELIAITFLIVYVGAIAVLFLFVVMMLNIKIIELDEVFWRYVPVALIISSIFLFQLFYFVFNLNLIEAFHAPVHLFREPPPALYAKRLEVVLPSPFFGIHDVYIGGVCDCSYDVYFTALQFFNDVYLSSFYGPPLDFYYPVFLISEFTNTQLLGWLIYTYTFFVFLVVGFILLVAMVGSIVLVLNQNINIKRQFVFRQIIREVKSSVSLKR